MESFKKNEIAWMEDEFSDNPTSVPDLIVDDTANQIGTLVIFIISAILAILALFVIAIFIDCRQQKLIRINESSKKRILKVKLPNIIRTRQDDEVTFSDKMYVQEPTASASNIV